MILAEDESHVNLMPWLRSTWIVKGERQEVMTPGKNQKRSIFGAIELATGRWLYSIVERATSTAFTDFLEQILDATPRRRSSPSCSTTSAHSSRAVTRWLAAPAHARVRLLYGARYSPHHNPVERVWGAVKRHLTNSPTLSWRAPGVHAFFSFSNASPDCWPPRRRAG